MIGLIKGTARQAKSVSGLPLPIATYNGNLKAPIKKLSLSVNPTQSGSGDPAPDNIRPITGVSSVDVKRFSGPNYWDEQWEAGGYDNTTGAKNVQYGRIRNKNLIKVNSSTTYYVKFNSSAFVVLQYDINKNFISGVSSYTSSGVLNTSANTAYINFYLVANEYGNDISINYPSTDHDYHAYTGNTYTIDLDGTRYGGTIDIVDGEAVMTCDRGYAVFNSSKTHSFKKNSNNYGVGIFVLADLSLPAGKTNAVAGDFLSNKLKGQNSSSIYNYSAENTIGLNVQGTQVYVTADTNHNSSETYETWLTSLGDIQLVYPLATPFTVNLGSLSIPSLLGQNNIWHDGNGNVDELVYVNRQLYYGR